MTRKGLIVVEQMPVRLIRTLIQTSMGFVTPSDRILSTGANDKLRKLASFIRLSAKSEVELSKQSLARACWKAAIQVLYY